ncbi:hypothetical protein Bca52824_023256 [Brassica carinata]|uniref:Uncharacterized protein n=1 Tax=Brassica carinata TaxID=52824 RepID=A0A8X7VHU3_BRACI|nr:hypothetical protein Bca52824_023256 [Brassica carinata]
MSHRFSRAEKGKAKATDTFQHKPLVKSPPPLRRNDAEKISDSGFEKNKRQYDDKSLTRRSPLPLRGTSDHREHHENNSSTAKTQARGSASVELTRGNQNSPARGGSTRSNQSPATAPSNAQKRQSISSRLSNPRSGNASGDDKVSAIERLSVNTQRINRSEGVRLESGNLHNTAPQRMEMALQPHTIDPITRPLSSNVFDSGRLGPCERSPIKTLSEDRIYVSLCLGPLVSNTTDETDETDESKYPSFYPGLSAKAVGKRIAKRYTTHSPQQGIKMKRRRTTKAIPSPR